MPCPVQRRILLAAWLASLATPAAALAQGGLPAERIEYAAWLAESPISPMAAVAHRTVGRGLTIGPAGSDIPAPGLATHRLTVASGAARLEGPDGRRALPFGRPVAVGRLTLLLASARGSTWVTVFDASVARKSTSHFPPAPALSFVGPLVPAARRATAQMLTLDGIVVEAEEAGQVRLPMAGDTVSLAVRRVPDPASGEVELTVYFQDATNGDGTYPSGRFVTLDPLADGRYRLDFNRARNPFCAYSSAYPCPVPWPGNRVDARIEAGERYGAAGAPGAPAAPAR
ncbi:MAG: DUF1684 domain-containing protein [Gemmatimonadales bacterium]